jgi:hypothetical protein
MTSSPAGPGATSLATDAVQVLVAGGIAMHTWSFLSTAGVSLVMILGSFVDVAHADGAGASHASPEAWPAAQGVPLPFEAVDEQEKPKPIERNCTVPAWNDEKAPCAAFALLPGQSVEIVLKEVKNTNGKDETDKIYFRLYDILSKKNVANFTLTMGVTTAATFKNDTASSMDLILYGKNDTVTQDRNIRFTYQRK